MSRKQSSVKTTVTHLYRTGQFTGRVVINYGFLLGVGVLLLYTALGRDFIAGITWAATQIGGEFTKIGWYRFITAILALFLFIYGFSNNNWRQRHRIITTIGLFALIAIPAFFVLLGQIVLSTTELRLVADAFQSAGSLLLVILTVSYVAATRDMHKSNWEMIFDRRKEHYRPTAKRIVTDFIDPSRQALSEQQPMLISAKNGILEPLPCRADLPNELIEDMESLEYLKEEHEWKRGRIKPYDLDTISYDARNYRRWQKSYGDRYDRIFRLVQEGLYNTAVTNEGPVELTEEEAQIVRDRLDNLAKYLLEAYPIWHHEIEHDLDLVNVYPKLYEERTYFMNQADPHFEYVEDLAEDMLEVNMKFITKPNKLSDWRYYIMEAYYISESEV